MIYRHAEDAYKLGSEAFSSGLFEEAALHYAESAKMFTAAGISDKAFMSHFQVIMCLKKHHENLGLGLEEIGSSPNYFNHMKQFVNLFKDYGDKENKYRERYIQVKYRYLLSLSYHQKNSSSFNAQSYTLNQLAEFVIVNHDIFRGRHYQQEQVFRWRMMAEQAKFRALRARQSNLLFLAEEYKRLAELNHHLACGSAPDGSLELPGRNREVKFHPLFFDRKTRKTPRFSSSFCGNSPYIKSPPEARTLSAI